MSDRKAASSVRQLLFEPTTPSFSRINLSNLREEEEVISVEMNQRALEVTHNALLPPSIKPSDRKPPVLTSPLQQ